MNYEQEPKLMGDIIDGCGLMREDGSVDHDLVIAFAQTWKSTQDVSRPVYNENK